MAHALIEQSLTRAQRAIDDSDFTYFFSLLLAAEALAKTVTLGLVSAIADDKERNRYRLEHALARADGIGDWSRVLDDALGGPASQFLITQARAEQADLTRLCRSGEWQHTCVAELKLAMDALGIAAEQVPERTDLKRWFRLFATFRNKTRAHGAPISAAAAQAAIHLCRSVQLLYEQCALLKRPWAYLHRNLSGKYRVSMIAGDATPFEYLKRDRAQTLPNGVYVFWDMPRLVPLMQADSELRDFFLANGGFNQRRFEMLSYATDDRVEVEASIYLTPPGTLPPSETEGYGELQIRGNCFSNAPTLPADYVSRVGLENQLHDLLVDDRRAIVTLQGSGGIGKTSLSLKVLERIYSEKRFETVVWFSARDVDLQASGPKAVRPAIVSPVDVGKLYAELVLNDDQLTQKGFNARAYLESQLQKNEIGPCLYVFDNFETTSNPVEMFNWIDTFVRLPNKILITTRLRDFKGDYPVEVLGMNDEEARALIKQTAAHIGIADLLTPSYIEELIDRAGGHPYVMKILLGEVAKNRAITQIPRIVAGRDDILVALFERTYAALSPCAQRAFMTLAAWNSAVPRVALEAVFLQSVPEHGEVERGIDALIQYSLAESRKGTDGQDFISVPLVASVFGKKKLQVSPLKAAVEADVEILQMLGATRADDIHLGLAKRLERFISEISRRIDKGDSFERYEPMLDMICRAYPPGWLIVARWHFERGTLGDYEQAKDDLQRYLENEPASSHAGEAWRMLGHACYQTGDLLGEVHAFIERAQLDSVPFHDVSNTANRLNRLFRDGELSLDKEHKRQLALRLLQVLDKRRGEADADDSSRMAWLALHVDQDAKAREYALAGLALDQTNPHCRRVAQRLGLAVDA